MQEIVVIPAAQVYRKLKQRPFCTFHIFFGLGYESLTSSTSLCHCGKINP